MADSAQQQPDRYALVNSLYGPGTIACWYLTLLSVLVSWTLHPRKRKSGSIDVDLVAVLTLPSVAAGHLISQILMLMHRHGTTQGHGADTDHYSQLIAAIEAPFSVVEFFMPIAGIMCLLAMWNACLRRAVSVSMIGLLCLATECYIHFSNFKELGVRYKPTEPESDDKLTFKRSFVADFAGLVIPILVIAAVCAVAGPGVVTYMLCFRKSSEDNERAERRASDVDCDHDDVEPVALDSARTWSLSIIASYFLTMGPAVITIVAHHYSAWDRIKIFASHFYPRSSNSFSDLDQAVATAAGATILGFRIYSIAESHYEKRNKKQMNATGGSQHWFGSILSRLKRAQT